MGEIGPWKALKRLTTIGWATCAAVIAAALVVMAGVLDQRQWHWGTD